MREAVNWLSDRDAWRRAVIITDSLSLVDALCGREGGGRLEGLESNVAIGRPREITGGGVGARPLWACWK